MASTIRQPSLLGIDLGTSSVKAVVTDDSGRVIAQSVAGYPVSNPHPGWAEADPDHWLTASVTAVRQAVHNSGTSPVAVGLSGQMHGVVPTSDSGRPVRPAMLWADSRAVPQLARYRTFSDATRSRLANPLSPGMAGPMLAWLATQETGNYARTRWALQPKDWLRSQFTESFAAEPSDASATLLYDVVGDAWDREVIDGLRLDPEMFPALLPRSCCTAGTLTPQAADLFKLSAGIPVAAGAADTAAAALGSGLVAAGTAQLTIGTGAQIVTPLATLPPVIPASPTTHIYRAATDHGWYRMGAVLSAGLTLGWVCEVLAASWSELFASAALDPAAQDPFFLPHLNGERTPYLDPDLRGAWTKLSPRHDRNRLLRAALEGVAFAIADAVDEVVATEPDIDELQLAGGGSTDPAWRQLLADVLGYPLRAVDVPAASGRGAALLAGRAAGLDTALDDTSRSGATGARRTTDMAVEPRTRPRSELRDYYSQRRRAFTAQVVALQQQQSAPPPVPGGA
jgi:xylulokinase